MKIDIIGSKFSRKLTEFKNFGFDVNNIVEGQSILSLLSEPYETTMKELNTTDLNDITVAYRDLNKLLYPELMKSESETVMIDLLSELNELIEYNTSYYNASSFYLLASEPESVTLSNIQKFRAFYNYLNQFLEILKRYEKVIIIKVLPINNKQQEFINGLYQLIEDKVEHKLILTVDNNALNEKLDAPIELYSEVNQDLKKFSSDNYNNQLLFNENLDSDILSVYINYVEEREYIYELYKDGKPFKKSQPTTSRYYSYTLSEPGKYRIRVTLTDQSVNPRFSLTYKYDNKLSSASEAGSEERKYIEMPERKHLWMLDIVLSSMNFEGLVGNAYLFPEGYQGYPVYLMEEVKRDFLKKEEILPLAIDLISDMSHDKFNIMIEKHQKSIKSTNQFLYNFIEYLHKNNG